jgi:hypothetical protein
MIHFLYLIGFAFFVSVALGVFSNGAAKEKLFYGAKLFAQFIIISMGLAWIFYFIPG